MIDPVDLANLIHLKVPGILLIVDEAMKLVTVLVKANLDILHQT